MPDDHRIICVDLDGTLCKTDTLHEILLRAFKTNPLSLIKFLFSLSGGKELFKKQLAEEYGHAVEALPWQEELIQYLKEKKEEGYLLYLVTGANEPFAKKATQHLHLFEDTFGSKDGVNLTSKNKAEFLVEKFGSKNFIYIGNSSADIPVWQVSQSGITVNASKSVREKAEGSCAVKKHFSPKSLTATCKGLAKSLRPHQWAKNVLVFLALISAHEIFNFSKVIDGVLAFIAFSFCASSVYIVNDLLDLDNDRAHYRKRKRVFASGAVDLHLGVLTAPLLLILAIITSCFLPTSFQIILGVYIILTTAYSWLLKKMVLVDVIVLASLYMIRVLAGALAADLEITFWVLAFAIFTFLSLGFMKRYIEIAGKPKSEKSSIAGRGYIPMDQEVISTMGIASGFLATLVFTFYIISDKVASLYKTPEILWGGCLLILYWICRVWILAHRNQVHDDPVVFALKDKPTYVVGIIMLILAQSAKHLSL